MLTKRMPRVAAAVSALFLGTLFIAGCNNNDDDDSAGDKSSFSSTRTDAHRNDKQLKAGYEKKKEDAQLSSDRRFHQRYDRNYDDQFEAAH